MPTYTVSIQPAGTQFEVTSGETILQAARRQGVIIPYGCHSGVCGACISRVIEGRIAYPDGQPLALFDEDVAAGRGLCCVGRPLSDLVIEPLAATADWEPWDR